MGNDDFLRNRLDKKMSELDVSTSTKQDSIITAIGNIPTIDVSNLSTSVKQLPDGHNVNVSNMISSVETGLSKEITQLEIKSLVETLQELNSRLTVLAACKGVQESLRVTPISLPTLSALTTLTTLTNFGTGYPAFIVAVAESNQTAILSNINNTIGK